MDFVKGKKKMNKKILEEEQNRQTLSDQFVLEFLGLNEKSGRKSQEEHIR